MSASRAGAGPGRSSPGTVEESLDRLIREALEEDVGSGDRTTAWTVPRSRKARGRILAREPLVLAGTEAAVRTFLAVDPELSVERLREDGEALEAGEVALRVAGRGRSILTAERTALNFLGRLSGVATHTRRFVEALEGTGTRVVDTRKTTPGWRALEKAAVRAGGGENHRMGLWDMVLVKENHIAAAGGIGPALERVREANREGLAVEVEVRSLEELEEALPHRPDRILLDNMSPALLASAVERARQEEEPPELEASGNVTLATVREVARSGVDLVSVGALTHSAPVVDLSLLMEGVEGP